MGRPCGSDAVRDDPGRLVEQVVDEPRLHADLARRRPRPRRPRDRPAGRAPPPRRSRATRRRSIRSSQVRRLPSPAWASTFWRRTPSPSSGTVRYSSSRSSRSPRSISSRRISSGSSSRPAAVALELVEPLAEGGARRGAQPRLEVLDHVGARHELARAAGARRAPLRPSRSRNSERGAEQDRLPGTRVLADLGDEAALLERADHAVDVHAADRRHLRTGDRLLVGDDGERLERRRRQARRLALEHEPLDVGRQVGVALEAPAAGHRHEGEPAPLGLVLLGQARAELRRPERRGSRAAGRAAAARPAPRRPSGPPRWPAGSRARCRASGQPS